MRNLRIGKLLLQWAMLLEICQSFSLVRIGPAATPTLSRTVLSDAPNGEYESDANTVETSAEESIGSNIPQLKTDLLRACSSASSQSKSTIASLIRQLEEASAEPSMNSNPFEVISGDWELVYASDDPTRSSPFFWAFQKAFPDTCDQVFQITDSIPSSLKEIGPAIQSISFDPVAQTGRLVSRVKVAALGGAATSIMTTKASITGTDGRNGLVISIETTKPENSSILNTLLGPLGPVLNENAPAFPSGQALEQVMPGSSTVVMQTVYCDEGLRVSRNKDRPDSQFFVWKRKEFASYEYL